MFLFTQIVLGLTLLGNIILLTFLHRAPKKPTVTVFTVYVSAVTVWTAGIFANLWLESLFVEHVIFAAASVFLVAQLWFVKLFPQRKEVVSFWEYWSITIGILFFILSFIPDLLFTQITVHEHGHTLLENGPFMPAYSIFGLLYVLIPLGILFRKYRYATGDIQKQLRSLLIGFGIFVAVNLFTNMLLPVYFNIFIFNAIGPVFSLALAAFIFYLIRTDEFFDIRYTVQRGVIYSLTLGLILILYIGLLSLIERSASTAVAAPVSALLLLIVGIYTVPVIERFFTKWTDRFFFKDHYDYPEALESLSAILHTSVDFNALVKSIETTLQETLRASSVTIELTDNSKGCDAEHVELRQPIILNDETIGHIVVCEKKSGDPYTEEDKHLLTTFAYHAATALGRARLFRELEDKVEERTAEVRALHENQSQMMLDIAHGLQTPLAVFKNNVDQMENAETLNRSLMDLSHFIDDLLTLARLETTPTTHQSVNLSELLADVVEEVETIASADDVVVTSNITPNIHIQGDLAELRAVLMNLASNALKYMGDGKKKLSFALSKTDDVLLSVSDTGIGIAEGDLPHVFDRFYRVKASRKTGNGLGLAITKRIVEKHNGTIAAESTLGEGSTFTIAFSS
ncbi:hypothetical protein KTR10_02350 [Candidatus Kaiserbacteria bacterium]|nr:hypothetical protein [Candidatus Kaiserbacteria bacterium]